MKSDMDRTGFAGEVMDGIMEPTPAATVGHRIGQRVRRGLATLLSALMIAVPMGQQAFAQYVPLPGTAQAAPAPAAAQPLTAEQIDQTVAPIALYPDALVAQILVAATYPTQVVEADRWRQSMGNAPADQIAAQANEYGNWDPSVKALTAFPSVLAMMDRNLQWTTDLGNAYYNQPQDVMDSIQSMRQRAQSAGQLRNTPQQVVTEQAGTIAIAPANPAVVYVPVYNPWVVYGAPVVVYPGYYYAPSPGVVFAGGLAIGFGIGIGVVAFSHWGWGWHHWGCGWHDRAVIYNHTTYITHSTTVINRGFNRPGGPGRYYGPRGAYARTSAPYRSGMGRPDVGYRGGPARPGVARPGNYAVRSGNYAARPEGRPAGNIGRPEGNYGRPAAGYSRPSGGGYERASVGRGGSAPAMHGGSGGGGHFGGGGSHGAGHGGGHEGHGR